jgi:hypothetical protein
MTVLLDVGREEGVPTEINTSGVEASMEVVEMLSQQNQLVVSREIVQLCHPVPTTILHNSNGITLYAPVGRILRIEYQMGKAPYHEHSSTFFSTPPICPLPPLKHLCHHQTACIFSTHPKSFGVISTSYGFLNSS